MNFLFVCLYRSWSCRGWPIFSMLDVLFSRWVFIHLSLHESGSNRDAQSQNEKEIYFMLSNNKFLGKCWYGRYPLFQTSRGVCLLVVREYKLYHSVWEPPIMCVTWKISRSLGCYVDNECIPLKILFNLYFKIELWHLYKSLLPSAKGLSIYFHAESSSSYKKHQLESTTVICMHCY